MLHRDVIPWLKVGIYLLFFITWGLLYGLAIGDWRVLGGFAGMTVMYALILWRWNRRLNKEERRKAAAMLQHLKEEGKPDVDLTK